MFFGADTCGVGPAFQGQLCLVNAMLGLVEAVDVAGIGVPNALAAASFEGFGYPDLVAALLLLELL